MTDLELVRGVVEILVLLVGAGGALRWLAGKLWNLHAEVRQSRADIADLRGDVGSINKRLDRLNDNTDKTIERVAKLEGHAQRR